MAVDDYHRLLSLNHRNRWRTRVSVLININWRRSLLHVLLSRGCSSLLLLNHTHGLRLSVYRLLPVLGLSSHWLLLVLHRLSCVGVNHGLLHLRSHLRLSLHMHLWWLSIHRLTLSHLLLSHIHRLLKPCIYLLRHSRIIVSHGLPSVRVNHRLLLHLGRWKHFSFAIHYLTK